MSTPGSDRVDRSGDAARPAFDALFEDPADSPPVLDPRWRDAPAPAAQPDTAEPADAADSVDEPDSADVAPAVDEPGAADLQDAADAVADDEHDEPIRPGRTVDTGRLFRSAGAQGPAATGAIPALTDDRLAAEQTARGLADDDAATDQPARPGEPVVEQPPADEAADLSAGAAVMAGDAVVAGGAAAADADSAVPVIPGGAGSAPPPISDPRAAAFAAVVAPESVATAASGRGLTGTGVWVVVVGVTVLVGFADALLNRSAGLGWITGVALVAATVYAAVTVRPADLWLAVIVPPLAFLAATVTAGQLTLPAGQGLLVREGLMIFTTLSNNAPWIIGATALALVIVLVRRSRARKAGLL